MARCIGNYGFLLGIVIGILILWTIVAGDLRNRVSFWTGSSSSKRVQSVGFIDRLT
jgi:hypothetical protein